VRLWQWGLSLAVGVAAGIGTYTFRYAEGLSYFETDPRACVNCHIMQSEYDAWQTSSHHAVAVCVDCHLTQAFVPK
jgi:cytochrome c nitrite reductase small subunit